MSHMDFSIIIVSWNVKEVLRKNIQTMLGSSQQSTFEIIVIDNDSKDGTVSMIQSEFPSIRLIVNQENLGFAKASNQGLKIASGDFLILLNPDMKIFPDTLENLKLWLENNPQADVTGISLIDEQGNIVPHVRQFPSIWDQVAIILKLPHIFPSLLHSYLQTDFDYSKPGQVDSVRGAFFVIRKSSLQKFGLLDERYFLWFEEVDYCQTVKQQGGQVWYTPATKAIDYIGQSFSQLPRAKKQIYFRNSMIAYFKKWKSPWQTTVLSIFWLLAEVIVVVGDRLHLKSKTRT